MKVVVMRRSHPDTLSLTHSLATPTYGLVSRHLLRAHGIDRHRLRRLTMQGALLPQGNHAVQVTSAPWDTERSPIVAAVINSGASAWADGAAALVLAGLTGHPLAEIDVGVPENAATRQVPGVRRHRFHTPPRLRCSPVTHAEPAHAALHAAAWSSTDVAAASVLEACVRQHLASAQQLRLALDRRPTLHRRGLIKEVVSGLNHSQPPLHAIDLRRLCRQRGIPEPDRTDLRLAQSGGGANLEARWSTPCVTLRIEERPYPLSEESATGLASEPTIARPGDRVLHTCVATLNDQPHALFERMRHLVTTPQSVQEPSC